MRNSLIRLTRASTLIAILCLLALAFNAEARLGVGYADTTNLTGGQSLSAVYSLNKGRIQAFFGIDGTEPEFDFGIGGAYKFTLIGDQNAGIHAGPGVALGSEFGEFAFAFFGLAGFHYTIADRLLLSVDGGPILRVVDGDANFSVEPMGHELLGLSIHYLF